MTAVDINGTTLSSGDNVLVLFGTIASLDSATANRGYLQLPDGMTLYVDTERIEKIGSASIASAITAVVATVLVGYVEETRAINTTAPLTGGGDLTADRTLAISNFGGDSGAGGTKGAVPAPAIGDGSKFLKGDGTWSAPTATAALSSTAIAFTDGDTIRRVTVTDASVAATDKILVAIRRPDIATDADDGGYLYVANVVLVAAGSFDVVVSCCTRGFTDATESPPSETIQLIWSRAA